MSWIKKEVSYIKESLNQIINAFLLFFLTSSGLGFAILLNYLNLSGSIIAFLSVMVQLIALILSYLLFRRYFSEKEDKGSEAGKQK
jgi:hypothetical protein